MTITQLGQFKYGLAKNKITGTVDLENGFTPGRYWIGFWREFIEFPSTLNTIEFSDEQPEEGVQHLQKLLARDNQGKQIRLDVSVQYRLLKENLGKIYREMTTLYEDVFISELRDQLSKACNEFSINEVWTDYKSVVQKLFVRCVDILKIRGAECWGLQIWGVSLDAVYEDQIIKTQVQKQKEETAEAELEQARTRAETEKMLAKYSKEIKIVNAEATANKINIEREAIAKAEANRIEAQAKVLKIIKDTVNLNHVSNNAFVQTANVSAHMTDEQLVIYQKYVMLQTQEQSHVIVDLQDGLGSLNVPASNRRMLESNPEL